LGRAWAEKALQSRNSGKHSSGRAKRCPIFSRGLRFRECWQRQDTRRLKIGNVPASRDESTQPAKHHCMSVIQPGIVFCITLKKPPKAAESSGFPVENPAA
jgi:hypothetical protein